RQAVNLVVHHDVGQVDVAPHRMDEMVASNPVAVAIAASADDFQFVVAELDAGGHGEGSAMQGVHAVGVDIPRQVRGATDTADDTDLMRLQAEVEERGLESGEDGE